LNLVGKGDDQRVLDHVPEAQRARLYVADHPDVRHLRPDSGAVSAQPAPDMGEGGRTATAPCARPSRGRSSGAVQAPDGMARTALRDRPLDQERQ
jgi:hypothetical protein